jgi:hypothetical protein
MAGREGIYFLFRVQLDPQWPSLSEPALKCAFNSPSQSSAAEHVCLSACETFRAFASGGDAL